jgi:hypothetical protein
MTDYLIDLTHRASRFFSALLLFLALASSAVPGISIRSVYGQSPKPLVIIVVDSSVYDAIKPSLDQYCLDLEGSGFSVNITETSRFLDKTPTEIRAYLQEARNNSLAGALFVGDVPEVWFRVGDNTFPTDMYYMDLDGVWSDLDNDGVYDARGGNLLPEIWIGRLKVSTLEGDSVSLLNSYFQKNHRYRNHLVTIPWWRALLYMDDLGVIQKHDGMTPLRYIAPEVTDVSESETTNAFDYRERLQDTTGYQWLYLMCHGTAINHTFLIPSKQTYYAWDGTIDSSEYRTLDPHVFFYHFFVCSAGRYTEKDYLAGSAVLGNNYGLLAVASTDYAYTYSYNGFYSALSQGNSVGEAFLQWLKSATIESMQPLQSNASSLVRLNSSDYEILLHDSVLIGDPTLKLYTENHDIALRDLRIFSETQADTEKTMVSLKVENTGSFTETFNITVFIDSDRVHFSTLTLEARRNETIVFSPGNSSRYIRSGNNHHVAEANATVFHGEFNVNNNFIREYFDSKVVPISQLGLIPEVVFALGGILIFGFICFNAFKLLMSDRPLYVLRMGIRRVQHRITGHSRVKRKSD